MARTRSVADQLVGQLVAAGVRHIYGIVGDSLNPVVDAVRRTRASRSARSTSRRPTPIGSSPSAPCIPR